MVGAASAALVSCTVHLKAHEQKLIPDQHRYSRSTGIVKYVWKKQN